MPRLRQRPHAADHRRCHPRRLRQPLRGIWFDNFELNRFLDQAQAAEQVVQQVRPAGDGFFDYSNPRTCPRCGDVKLLRHFATRKRQVELDSCGGCGGHWLDAHELARLRRERAAAKGEATGPV